MKLAAPVLWLVLLLGGCATTREAEIFDSPGAALAETEAAVEQGRWSEALAKLDDALQQYPEDTAVAERRAQLRDRWAKLEAEWEDRLVLVRGQGLREELALRERLETARAGSFADGFWVAQKRTILRHHENGLLRCAQRQQALDVELAHDCVDLAYWIRPSTAAAALRQEIERRQAEIAEATRLEQARVEAQRRNARLDRAELLLERWHLRAAAELVQQVLAAEPEHPRAKVLEARLNSNRARRTRELGDIAEQLYGEGKIAEAIRLWETSLQVDPEQPEVRERYERAQRVQGRLEQLRQAPPAPQVDGKAGGG